MDGSYCWRQEPSFSDVSINFDLDTLTIHLIQKSINDQELK